MADVPSLPRASQLTDERLILIGASGEVDKCFETLTDELALAVDGDIVILKQEGEEVRGLHDDVRVGGVSADDVILLAEEVLEGHVHVLAEELQNFEHLVQPHFEEYCLLWSDATRLLHHD